MRLGRLVERRLALVWEVVGSHSPVKLTARGTRAPPPVEFLEFRAEFLESSCSCSWRVPGEFLEGAREATGASAGSCAGGDGGGDSGGRGDEPSPEELERCLEIGAPSFAAQSGPTPGWMSLVRAAAEGERVIPG